jgi:hypothetical protein
MRRELKEEEEERGRREGGGEKKMMTGVELANSILNSESIKPNKRLIFAGKEYILNE